MGLFDKIWQGLAKTRESVAGQIRGLVRNFTKIDEDLLDELEELLICADVGVDTTEKLMERLRLRIKERGETDPQKVMGLLGELVLELLGEDTPISLNGTPAVILVVGVNGVGKTTTIAKLAHLLRQQGKNVLLAAADTFRAAAIEQLCVWGERAGVDVIRHTEGADPAAVVFDAVAAAKARHVDVLIVDTAGRLHKKKNLMNELAKIERVIERELPGQTPETLLVLDAATGQNALSQAKEFAAAAHITALALTKLDGTAKGGVVLAIAAEQSLPVKLIGVGEGIDDLQPFRAGAFVASLFGEEDK